MAKDIEFADSVKIEPVQKTTSIKPLVSPKEEHQLNVWIPKDLMKRLKVRGAEIDKSIKEMVTEALEQFL